MGLDAVVYCDCYERGRVRGPPPQPESVYVDANGQVCLQWEAPGADQNAFSTGFMARAIMARWVNWFRTAWETQHASVS
jgi:hypothetical protein